MKIPSSLVVIALLAAPAAQAQQWLVNNAIQNQIIETSICDSALKKHQKLPDICAKYPKYGMSGTTKGRPAPRSPATASSSVLMFTPAAGDTSLQQVADTLGTTPQEKQQLGQIAQAGKALFEKKYAAKGWPNNLAGAYAFFIISTVTIETGTEPDAEAQDRLFDALTSTLAQTPEVAKASAKDKTALYNMLVAGGGLPLIFFIDGQQQGNAAEIQQAKTLAARFSRTLMNSEPEALVGLVNPPSALPASTQPAPQTAARPSGTPDARYECMVYRMITTGTSFQVQMQPTGMWFVIKGGAYSAQNGSGRVDITSEIVSFHGGPYDGWGGARVNDAIVFHKDNHSNPQPIDLRAGDFRCGRQ